MHRSFYQDKDAVHLAVNPYFKSPNAQFLETNSQKDPLRIDSFLKCKSEVDPRVESFMTEVTKEIEYSRAEEQMIKEQNDRKEKVKEELQKIRDLEDRILNQNK